MCADRYNSADEALLPTSGKRQASRMYERPPVVRFESPILQHSDSVIALPVEETTSSTMETLPEKD